MGEFLMKKLALLALLSGCGTVPNQDAVVHAIWNDYYGENEVVIPPLIEWVYVHNKGCGGGDGFFIGDYLTDTAKKTCVNGVYWPDVYFSKVSYPDSGLLSHSSLAHELLHAHISLHTNREGDPNHTDPGFQSGGLVEQINKDLASRGY